MTIHGGERDTKKVLTILNQAAAWFCTCLNKDDMPVYVQSSWSPIQPYNAHQALRIAVLQSKATDQFLVSYGNRYFLYTTPRRGDRFYKCLV